MTESDALRIAIKAVEIYSARHPRPPHVTITQAAEMLGVSRPTARRILTDARVGRNHAGMVPIEEIDRVLAVHPNYIK
ncbi:DNA-binding protein [Burkholderia savannae]|uniref:DNA-binding protein n=1 Tax=Burkholderia savannae TaxID=1637837 RepID=UPI0009E72E44|nr:DNA-binding protein [Burkholderia savannae]